MSVRLSAVTLHGCSAVEGRDRRVMRKRVSVDATAIKGKARMIIIIPMLTRGPQSPAGALISARNGPNGRDRP